MTQDTNRKVINSQLDTTNESQEVSPFPAGDHKGSLNRHTQRHSKHKMIHKRSTALELSVKIFYWRALTGFTAPTSPLTQMWIKTHKIFDLKTPNLSMHHLLEQINQDIKRR